MCLDKAKAPTKTWGFGYKWVTKVDDGHYESWDCMSKEGTPYAPIGEWGTDANNRSITDHHGNSYPAGYHIMTGTPRHYKYWCNDVVTVHVRYRKAVAQETTPDPVYGNVVVAKEMKILREVLS